MWSWWRRKKEGLGQEESQTTTDSRKISVPPTDPPHHGESWSQSRPRGNFHISKDWACVSPPNTAHHGLGVAWGQQEARLNED